MSKATRKTEAPPPSQSLPEVFPVGVIVAAVGGLAAAWLAAGDAGLMAHSLRHACLWLVMMAAVVGSWPKVTAWKARLVVVLAVVAALIMTASLLPGVNVLAVAVLLAGLAFGRQGADRRVLLLSSQAVVLFGLYRLAVTSVRVLWVAADAVGGWLGGLGGVMTGEPLRVGASFAGVDVLVLMAAFLGLWLAATPGPRLARAVVAAVAIGAGHLVYLILLSYEPRLADAIPVPPPPPPFPYAPPEAPWSFWAAVATLLPWNFPALSALIQIPVACAMLRWSPPAAVEEGPCTRRAAAWRLGLAATLAAALLPIATSLYSKPASLAGKKFVANEKGFLNWLRPVHGEYGRLTIGMYGLLGPLIESFGGTLVRSADFSEQDLRDASAVILIFPNKPWEKGQLERIWNFVRRGGSLLVMGEHTIWENVLPRDADLPKGCRAIALEELARRMPDMAPYFPRGKFVVVSEEKDGSADQVANVFAHSLADSEAQAVENFKKNPGACFNDALFPTPIRVRFDCAQWAVGGWLDCYDMLAHPVTAWTRPDRNEFGVVIGASVDARWPARPLILGRWGWSDGGDAGSHRAMMGNDRHDAGERLGDICLVAEHRLGRGKVLVFGDTSSLTNGINIGCYGATASLLSYVADAEAAAPSAVWQGLAILALAAAATLLAWRPDPWKVGAVALAAAISLSVCTAVTHRANRLIPDGRLKTPNNLAYIDASHLEACSLEGLRDNGTMGLELTLMRSGFMTHTMTDFDPEALERAALFISIAPSREFSRGEREAVRRFVDNGGIFICTVGYDASGPVAPLLADFGLRFGDPKDPQREPRPMGHFKSAYVNVDGREHYVRYDAAWPVAADALPSLKKATVVAKGLWDGKEVPVILVRPYGEGKVVLVGDTGFAMNKNLEHMDGSPFEGMRENADFWRWFLPALTGGPPWLPPGPEEKPPAKKAGPGAGKGAP